MPGSNQDTADDWNVEGLNESVLTVLKENMGVGAEKVVSARKRGMKCVPGKRITNESLTTPDSSLTTHHPDDGEKQGPSSQSKQKKTQKVVQLSILMLKEN